MLIGLIGLLQFVLHEVTVAERAPYLAVVRLEAEYALEIVDSLETCGRDRSQGVRAIGHRVWGVTRVGPSSRYAEAEGARAIIVWLSRRR